MAMPGGSSSSGRKADARDKERRKESMRFRKGLRFVTLLCSVPFFCSAIYGQGILAPREPIVIDPQSVYPMVPTPPGPPFSGVSYGTSSIIGQLAHSSDGVVRLPPGDYTILVRMYCTGIHVAGTQRGLRYALAPLTGSRAPILRALLSRSPAARVEYWPLQQLIWEIEGGLTYNEMPVQSISFH